MIYSSQERAQQVADQLNATPGYAPAAAVHTKLGWTVVSSFYHNTKDYSHIYDHLAS